MRRKAKVENNAAGGFLKRLADGRDLVLARLGPGGVLCVLRGARLAQLEEEFRVRVQTCSRRPVPDQRFFSVQGMDSTKNHGAERR